MNRYVDTSVLIAYYLPEQLSARAERLLRHSGTPAISPLVEVEFASVLGRKVRARELAVSVARSAQEKFREHLDNGMYLRLEIAGAHYDQARRWIDAFKPPLRTLDALHLSIAANANATLLTADIQLSRAARALRVPCRLLRVSNATPGKTAGRTR